MEDLLNIYQERFLENNIIVKSKKVNTFTHIDIVYEKQTYQIVMDKDGKFSPHRHNIHDIQLVKFIQNEDMMDMIENIFTYLPILKHFCTACNKKLEYKSTEFVTCGDKICAYKMEEIPMHPSEVVDYVKNNMAVSTILLIQALESVSSVRHENIFEPFPFFLTNIINTEQENIIQRGEMAALSKKEKQEKINQLKSKSGLFQKVVKELSVYPSFLTKVTKYNVDEEIIKDFGLTFYKLVKFILQSNKTRIELHHEKKGSFQIYKLTHEMDIENKMKSNLDTFLFHGSPVENWYSILRNGLKVTSQTSLMTSGAAHGTGLYFSNELDYSYAYSKIAKQGFLGVYQIYDDSSKYKKTGNIFVVNDPNIVLLRYLIYYQKPMDKASGDAIKKYFQSLIQTKAVPKQVASSKGIAKLLKEYREIQKKKPDELGFHVEVDDDNFYKWKVFINKFDENYPISKDMEKYKINQINMEMIFPENYPFHPPFIHMLNPRFKYQTGHITSEGAICMELLTPSGWTPIQSIESLLVQIKALIIEGDARLDEKRWNQPYTIEEAKKSFERVARGHGWLK